MYITQYFITFVCDAWNSEQCCIVGGAGIFGSVFATRGSFRSAYARCECLVRSCWTEFQCNTVGWYGYLQTFYMPYWMYITLIAVSKTTTPQLLKWLTICRLTYRCIFLHDVCALSKYMYLHPLPLQNTSFFFFKCLCDYYINVGATWTFRWSDGLNKPIGLYYNLHLSFKLFFLWLAPSQK